MDYAAPYHFMREISRADELRNSVSLPKRAFIQPKWYSKINNFCIWSQLEVKCLLHHQFSVLNSEHLGANHAAQGRFKQSEICAQCGVVVDA